MRRVLRILLLSSMGLAGITVAQARERLVMPFDCGLEGGRIKVSPAIPKSYPIIGARDQEAITTCRPPLASGCRTLMVHRFVISCGGVGVAWMRVVAAIGRTDTSRAWVDDGRLNVTVPARVAQGPGAACFDGIAAGGHDGLERRVVFMQECLPWRRHLADVDHLALPEGFAPIGEFGARLQLVSADPAYSLDEARLDAGLDDAALVTGRNSEAMLAKADPQAAVDPTRTDYSGSRGATMAGDEWVTVVRAERDYSGAPPPNPAGLPGAWTVFVIAFGLMTAAGAAHVRSSRAWPVRALASASGLARTFRRDGTECAANRAFSTQHLSNASAAVAALLLQTEATVAQLKGAGPLRDVLQSELKSLRGRLSNVETGVREGVPAANTGPHYRALVRELERIRRIAESAAASLSGGRPTTLPRTTSEAYEVLGVNADVSECVLKKIVDALRMSWHPDHARDEDDRRVREERIRQVNVAWDLITAKREAA